MKPRVALLGYKDFIDLTKGILKDVKKNVHIDVYQCFLEECREVLPLLERDQTDLIITGRANKDFLEKITYIPIITFHITPFDVLKAIYKSSSPRIAIAISNFENLEYDYTILQDLLHIDLELITYRSEEELKQKIRDFSKEHGTVIGTSIAVNYAKEMGLDYHLIYSLENTVMESIDRALEIIHFKREEEKRRKEFQAIIHSVSDGIIVSDNEHNVTLANPSVQKMLEHMEEEMTGKHLSQILDSKTYQKIIEGESYHDRLIKIGSYMMNIHRETIKVKNKKSGYIITLQDMTRIQKLEERYRIESKDKGLVAKSHFSDIITQNLQMKAIIERSKKYACSDSTILIIGETGTGKELFAQSIHNYSKRSSAPFVAINCAALPENLLESELFGYEEGAFTGASSKGKKGLFELAHNGTIFLDEINSVSLHFQARILRVLQEKEVVRIGSDRVIPVDVRVIAATNEDLMHLVKEKKLRTDLYYRLNVLKIKIPPLRERIEDIVPITREYIKKHDALLYKELDSFIESFCAKLKDHYFLGNIRELYNILERFVILCDRSHLDSIDHIEHILAQCVEHDFSELLQAQEVTYFTMMDNYKDSLLEAEKAIMTRFLETYRGDKSTLANQLGISRTTLYRKLNELGIEKS